MFSQLQKQNLRVGVISLIIALILFMISLTVWGRYVAAAGYEAMAACVAILCIASILLHQRGDSSSAPILLIAGFSYYAVVKLGGAIEKILIATSPLIQKTNLVLASDLLEIAGLGSVILMALVIHQRGWVTNNTRRNAFFVALFLGPLVTNGLWRFLLLNNMQDVGVVLIGVSAGIISFVILIGVGVIFAYERTLLPLNGKARMPVACSFLAISSVPSVIALFIPDAIWSLTIILQIVAFVIIYLALAPTFLRKYDIPKRASFRFTLIIMLLFVLPFFITLVAETILQGIEVENIGAYTVSIFGSTSMSAALAILIFTYAKRTEKKYQYPIAFIFSFWTIVGLANMLLSPFFPLIQTESMSSLILVTIFTIPAFLLAIRWLDSNSSNESDHSLEKWIALGLVGGVALVVISEIIQSTILNSNPALANSPLGGVILLSLNTVVIGEFIYLAFLIVSRDNGKISVESLSLGFLSLWIIQNVLKGIFTEWTVGWWLSEFLLLVGLLSGPAIMGYLYLGAFLKAEESGTRAKVYADILSHDISNHHQAILNAIEIALLDIVPSDMRQNVLREALQSLSDADGLTKNVQKLSQIESVKISELESLDLVISITESFNKLKKATQKPDLKINLNSTEGKHFIHANNLLQDIFLNLFRNTIEYSGTKAIDVEISEIHEDRARLWEVRIIDNGPGIAYEKRKLLFERFMKGAKGTGLGLSVVKALTELFGGSVRIEDRINGDFTQGSVFVLVFPVAQPTIMA